MPEPKLMRRRDLMDGFILSPKGPTVATAVRTADISNPQNRQNLQRKGNILLTQYNNSIRPRELLTEPPTLEACGQVIEVIALRKEQAAEETREHIREASEEMKAVQNSKERGFWRTRKKGLARFLAEIVNEEVMPEELYRSFLREDAKFRAEFVSPELKAQLQAIEREREILRTLPEPAAEVR